MNPKQSLLSLMGLARKAGKLAMGNDAAEEAMVQGETRLLILAGDFGSPHPPEHQPGGGERRRDSGGYPLDHG